MYDWLVEIHRQDPFVLKALLAGTLVSVVCGVLGCLIILRRMSFLADALSHSMIAGVACGYIAAAMLLGREASAVEMIVCSLFAGLCTVAIIGFISRFSRLKEDCVIGIAYTGVFALGGVLLSIYSDLIHKDLVHFVMGELLGISDSDLWMMAVVSGTVLSVLVLFYRQFQLISFDRVMAASIGVQVLFFDYFLTACTSLVVVSGVNMVGVIMVVALLITPAAGAYLLCDRLHRMMVVAAILGITSFWLGYYFAVVFNAAPGAMVVLTGTVQFLFIIVVAPRYGLLSDVLRRIRSVPQRLVEDILGVISREDQQRTTVSAIAEHLGTTVRSLTRALRYLKRQHMVTLSQQLVALTPRGQREARRLLRSHRIWESYLREVGTPMDQLHSRAHQLEHVHDEAVVDYLDDQLGHPLQDPHGSEIPEDFVHLIPGEVVPFALLREGHRGVVIESPATIDALTTGMEVAAGPRSADGRMWTVLLPEGSHDPISIDHKTADEIYVKLNSLTPG